MNFFCNLLKNINSQKDDYYSFTPPPTPKEFIREMYNEKNKHIDIVDSGNEKISIFYTPLDINKKTILFAHGNGFDIHTVHPFLLLLSTECNVNVFTFDYQGYGISTGTPTLKNTVHDFNIVKNYILKKGIKNENIILVGHSFGARVVLEHVNKNICNNYIILISPSNTVTTKMVSNLQNKISIIGGTDDTDTKPEHLKIIYDNITIKDDNIIWVNKAKHNDVLNLVSFNVFNILFN